MRYDNPRIALPTGEVDVPAVFEIGRVFVHAPYNYASHRHLEKERQGYDVSEVTTGRKIRGAFRRKDEAIAFATAVAAQSDLLRRALDEKDPEAAEALRDFVRSWTPTEKTKKPRATGTRYYTVQALFGTGDPYTDAEVKETFGQDEERAFARALDLLSSSPPAQKSQSRQRDFIEIGQRVVGGETGALLFLERLRTGPHADWYIHSSGKLQMEKQVRLRDAIQARNRESAVPFDPEDPALPPGIDFFKNPSVGDRLRRSGGPASPVWGTGSARSGGFASLCRGGGFAGTCEENPRSLMDDDYAFGDIEGCIEIFRTKTSGRYGGAYIGEDPDAGRYMAVCEGHNTVVGDTTLRGVKSSARDPSNFCDECRDDAPPNPETVARAEQAYERGREARATMRRLGRG
jgi:hypothetical protein